MESYEKKYKEVLERARIWQKHLYDTNDRDYADELNYIFPELAESEDEKIRKALIKFLNDCIRIDSGYFPKYCEISSEQMIAWLEKQGECQVKESVISQHENKTCKENNDSLTSKDDMMIEETLYFLREYQQSNRCKDESGMQNSVTCEKWLKSLKERIGG